MQAERFGSESGERDEELLRGEQAETGGVAESEGNRRKAEAAEGGAVRLRATTTGRKRNEPKAGSEMRGN
jgi:hypothetical protein